MVYLVNPLLCGHHLTIDEIAAACYGKLPLKEAILQKLVKNQNYL